MSSLLTNNLCFAKVFAATLEQMGDCIIVGDSTDPEEILEITRTENPDVVLLDANLNSADPLEIARQMRHIYDTLSHHCADSFR